MIYILGSKLVGKRDGQLGVLESMVPVKAAVGDGVAGTVDGGVLVGEGALEGEGGRITLAIPAGVVGAGITALL